MNTPFESYSFGSLIKSECITTEEWEENNSKDYSEYCKNQCKSDGNLECDSNCTSELGNLKPLLGGSYCKSEVNVKPLCCWVCEVVFYEYSSFILHHIQHITQPYVLLTDFNDINSDLLNKICMEHQSMEKPHNFTVLKPTSGVGLTQERFLSCMGKLPASNNKNKSQNKKDHSPLKLTLKKLSSAAHESTFEVVNRKKKAGGGSYQGVGRRASKTDTEGSSQGGEGEQSSPSPTSAPSLAPSPTPSEFLRPAGLLAPESTVPSPEENNEEFNGERSLEDDYPSSPPQLTREDLESSLPTTGSEDPSSNIDENLQNGMEEMDSEPDIRNTEEENNVDSGVECEKDGFTGFDTSENSMPLPTSNPEPLSNPIGCTLTVLAPSQVNNNAVVNGSLLSEQAESNVVSEAFNALGSLGNNIDTSEVREGLSVLSPAKLYNSSINMLNMDMNSTSDPLGLLRNYIDPQSGNGMEFMPLDRLGGETCEVCGERTIDRDAMDQHKSTLGHFKCHLSPDCAVVLFGSVSELSNHQEVTHGIIPTPPPVQQLAQQVQRLPVPYREMGTPPQSASPGYQNRSSPMYRVPTPVQMSYPQQPSPGSYNTNNCTSPFQGMIERPFAMLNNGPNQPSSPHLSLSPVMQMNQQQQQLPLSQLSPGNRVQKRPGSVGSAEGTPSKRRNEDTDCSMVPQQQQPLVQAVPAMPQLPGITLSVRGQQPQPQSQPQQQQQGKKSDANSVANILATRGITVTPTGNRGVPQPLVTSPRRNQQQSQVPVSPQPVTTLNLSSAISITPANQGGRQNQFAVPQGRSVGRQQVQVERPARLPTVDLTQDTTPVRNRNRMTRFTCQVCDKVFSTQDMLNQHMMTHRSPTKLPFRCTLCNAQYPTQQGLQQHKLTYHKETSTEMAIPIVDLKQQGVLQKLNSLGIRHVIPLSQLTNQADGTFGLPIVAMDNARNSAVCNLGRLGASNVFSIGPAKAIGR